MAITDSVREAVKTAIQMEKDGHAFYTKAAAQTSSDTGRQLFESLAEDEMVHLATFQKVFESRVGEDEWDALVRSSNKYAEIPIFPKDLKQVEGASPETNELDALHMAMDAEQKAIEYYGEIVAKADDDEIKKVIETIIGHERNHYLMLNEEFIHLTKTGFWYPLDVLGQ